MKYATSYDRHKRHLSRFRTSGVNIGHNLLLSVCLLLCDVVGTVPANWYTLTCFWTVPLEVQWSLYVPPV